MMRASLMMVIFIGVTCLLFGCAGPTRITSQPSDVSIFLNGTFIGTTPFSYKVKDIFGMNSSYGFTAEKAGYRPDTKIFREMGFDDAKAVIPPHIHFVLRPISGERPTTRDEPKPQADVKGLPVKKYATGSGFIVSDEGHVLTNYHIVDGCQEIRIPPATMEVLAQDEQSDLVLLKIPQRSATFATFREGRGVRAGEPIVVVGYPLHGVLSTEPNVTTGVVSALAGPDNDRRLIQITAPVQPGNSGGPLLDQSGNIVGVVVGTLSTIKFARATGTLSQNLNFAISEGAVRSFLDAHSVPYNTAQSNQKLDIADVAARAKTFTLLIECWK